MSYIDKNNRAKFHLQTPNITAWVRAHTNIQTDKQTNKVFYSIWGCGNETISMWHSILYSDKREKNTILLVYYLSLIHI